jgi:hypothetical protein
MRGSLNFPDTSADDASRGSALNDARQGRALTSLQIAAVGRWRGRDAADEAPICD